MSNLIDRQLAIDAVREALKRIPTSAIMAMEAIKGIPSAESDVPDINVGNMISRQDATRLAEQGQIQGFEWQFKKLCELPSAEPERKKGQWIPENRTMDAFWVCSACKFPSEAHAANILYNFCPNCGADMRQAENRNV